MREGCWLRESRHLTFRFGMTGQFGKFRQSRAVWNTDCRPCLAAMDVEIGFSH